MVSVLIVMSNYFHDVATAFLLSGAIVLFVFVQTVESDGRKEVINFFANNYRKFVKIIRYSLVWIILAGIIRIINFTKYEWLPAAGKGLIPAIIVKHILIFTFIVLGIYTWRKLFKKIDDIIKKNNY